MPAAAATQREGEMMITPIDLLREFFTDPEEQKQIVEHQRRMEQVYQAEAEIICAKLDRWLELQVEEDERNGRVTGTR